MAEELFRQPNIEIKSIAIEASPREPKLQFGFDVARYVSERDIEMLHEEVTALDTIEKWDAVLTLLSLLYEFSPEKAEDVMAHSDWWSGVKQGITTHLSHSRYEDLLVLSRLRSMLPPDRLDELQLNGDTRKHIQEHIKLYANTAYLRLKRGSEFITLFPDEEARDFVVNFANDKVWQSLVDFCQRLSKIPSNHMAIELTAYARVMRPDRFVDLRVDEVVRQHYLDIVEQERDGLSTSMLFEIIHDLKIIFARGISVTDHGIILNNPQAASVSENDHLPLQRSY